MQNFCRTMIYKTLSRIKLYHYVFTFKVLNIVSFVCTSIRFLLASVLATNQTVRAHEFDRPSRRIAGNRDRFQLFRRVHDPSRLIYAEFKTNWPGASLSSKHLMLPEVTWTKVSRIFPISA